jgi:hypothetical protein
MHKETLDDYYKQRARLWLGTSDMADPGKFGTQGAVGERVDATSDPKTVADAKRLAQSLHLSLLRNMILFNAKKLGACASEIPVPKLKAWKDETDMLGAPGATLGEAGGEKPASPMQLPHKSVQMPDGNPAPRIPEINLGGDPANDTAAAPPGIPPSAQVAGGEDIQKQALNGAQVTSLLELLTAVSTGALPRSSAMELIVSAFPITREQAERIMGTLGAGFVPTAQPEPTGPFGGGPPKPPAAPPPDGPPPVIDEIVLARQPHPKAAASGEPRLPAGPASTPSRTLSSSLTMRVGRAARKR